jgi:hypothetical protein
MEGDYCTQFGTEEITITRTAGDWRMIQCAALGAIDELDRKMDEIESDTRLSTVQRSERIDNCLSARASLDRLVSAIAETRKGCVA